MTTELEYLIDQQPEEGLYPDDAYIKVYPDGDEPFKLETTKAFHLLSNSELAREFCRNVPNAIDSMVEVNGFELGDDVKQVLEDCFDYVEFG